MLYLIEFIFGDRDKIGHGKTNKYKYVSNYSLTEIQNAYNKSCEQTNIYFHNKTGIDKNNIIWNEYGDYSINNDIIEKLKLYDINIPQLYDTTNFVFNDDAHDLLIQFIKLNMPKDWEYLYISENFETFNDILDIDIGYGLYIY